MKASMVKVADFKALKKAVVKANAKREKEAREKAVAKRKALSDRELFLKGIGEGVVRLDASDRVQTAAERPKPIPMQRLADEKKVLDESLSDEFSIENMLDTDDQLSFHREGLSIDIVKKLRRGHWVIQDDLDLHGMRRDEAREMVVQFLKMAEVRGIRCVRIVHGKGLGSINNEPILKKLVFKWLVQRSDVMAFCQAKPVDGGSGAVVVLLKGRTRP
ncbi:MAG: Smr/MutS family protein [Oxalobacter sp.]|nr:Smr/MutS family protein [Oxalobacter sp.]